MISGVESLETPKSGSTKPLTVTVSLHLVVDNTLSSLAATLPAPMALNNLLNLPPSKIALKPPLPPPPALVTPPRLSLPRLSVLRAKPPPPLQRVHSSASSTSDAAAPSPPSSREEAVSQARTCLAAALQKPLSSSVPLKKLKRQRQRQARLRAEIPVVDDSPGSLARLAFDVFAGAVSRKGAPAKLLLVWPSAEALAVALQEFKSQGDSTTAHAQLGSVAPDALGACDAAVFVAPALAQVEKVKAAAAELDPRPVVLFNPAWSFDEEEQDVAGFGAAARGFVASFNVVYSFTGLEVRGLLSKKRGVLLRCVDGGRFGRESWVLMVESDAPAKEGEFRVVSRLKRRPTIGEVETMLYNLMAANSPVTKSARFLREMVSNVTGGKGKQ
ncbi:hypothetical protein ACP70R_039671 [Stipagrostis hirtigluma subsp. patula]